MDAKQFKEKVLESQKLEEKREELRQGENIPLLKEDQNAGDTSGVNPPNEAEERVNRVAQAYQEQMLQVEEPPIEKEPDFDSFTEEERILIETRREEVKNHTKKSHQESRLARFDQEIQSKDSKEWTKKIPAMRKNLQKLVHVGYGETQQIARLAEYERDVEPQQVTNDMKKEFLKIDLNQFLVDPKLAQVTKAPSANQISDLIVVRKQKDMEQCKVLADKIEALLIDYKRREHNGESVDPKFREEYVPLYKQYKKFESIMNYYWARRRCIWKNEYTEKTPDNNAYIEAQQNSYRRLKRLNKLFIDDIHADLKYDDIDQKLNCKQDGWTNAELEKNPYGLSNLAMNRILKTRRRSIERDETLDQENRERKLKEFDEACALRRGEAWQAECKTNIPKMKDEISKQAKSKLKTMKREPKDYLAEQCQTDQWKGQEKGIVAYQLLDKLLEYSVKTDDIDDFDILDRVEEIYQYKTCLIEATKYVDTKRAEIFYFEEKISTETDEKKIEANNKAHEKMVQDMQEKAEKVHECCKVYETYITRYSYLASSSYLIDQSPETNQLDKLKKLHLDARDKYVPKAFAQKMKDYIQNPEKMPKLLNNADISEVTIDGIRKYVGRKEWKKGGFYDKEIEESYRKKKADIEGYYDKARDNSNIGIDLKESWKKLYDDEKKQDKWMTILINLKGRIDNLSVEDKCNNLNADMCPNVEDTLFNDVENKSRKLPDFKYGKMLMKSRVTWEYTYSDFNYQQDARNLVARMRTIIPSYQKLSDKKWESVAPKLYRRIIAELQERALNSAYLYGTDEMDMNGYVKNFYNAVLNREKWDETSKYR